MSIDIKVPLRDSLGLVGVQPDKVSFTDPLFSEVTFVFLANWYYTVESKDTVIKNVVGTENFVDEEALKEFERFNREVLEKDKTIQKSFSHSLEELSASELFKLGNKINRLSVRKAKGQCTCPDCSGTQKMNCPNCSGFGLIICPSCQGRDGGCARCKKSGYIECPTCRGNKKILCQKCKGKGSIYVEKQVYLETHCAPLIKIEFEKAEDSFNVPPPSVVDFYCCQKILDSLEFRLSDADTQEDYHFLMTYKCDSSMGYLKFCLAGFNKIFEYWATASGVPLVIPSVLDYVYSSMRADLIDTSIGRSLVSADAKIFVLNNLKKDHIFNNLLRSYEYDFDLVTKRVKNQAVETDAYTSKVFSMKAKLESIVASRKEELTKVLSNKLLRVTQHFMSESFAKDCCMALVEFFANLKYRRKFVTMCWNFGTLFVWGLTLLLTSFIGSSGMMFICMIISLVASSLISYFGSKNLRIFEIMLSLKCFKNITKFIDLNYDIMRSLIMMAGVIIIEFVVSNLQ